MDTAWADARAVTTGKAVSGAGGAVATVRTLWRDQTLYVLAEVADPVVDVSGSDPWTRDSGLGGDLRRRGQHKVCRLDLPGLSDPDPVDDGGIRRSGRGRD